jgi:hypothetical protein
VWLYSKNTKPAQLISQLHDCEELKKKKKKENEKKRKIMKEN